MLVYLNLYYFMLVFIFLIHFISIIPANSNNKQTNKQTNKSVYKSNQIGIYSGVPKCGCYLRQNIIQKQ